MEPAPAPKVAPSQAPKAALPHPMMKDEFDRWDCKECGWMYPNAHPSAKIRRNHKKVCGKVAAAAPVPGGSSEDDSGDERHNQSVAVEAPKPEAVNGTSEVAPTVTTRDFNLASLTAAAQEVPAESTPAPEKNNIETAPAVSILSNKDATPEIKKEEAPVDAAPKGLPHPMMKDEFDRWDCKECGWMYPNAHPSAKIRRNHKKVCGKVAATAPATGGTSDDSGDEDTAVEAPKPEAVNATSEETPSVTTSTRDFNLSSLAVEAPLSEQGGVATSAETPVEVEIPKAKPLSSEVPAESPSAAKETNVEASPAVVPKDVTPEIKEEAPAPTATPNGLPHPMMKDENDRWDCKECGWMYPNAHPSAKVRRNHKKVCGKVAAAAPATGVSSDDSGDELAAVDAPKSKNVNAISEELPSVTTGTRDFSLSSLAVAAPLPDKIGTPEIPSEVESPAAKSLSSQAQAESTPAAEEKNFEEAPAVLSKDVTPEIRKEETRAPDATPRVGPTLPHPMMKDEHDRWDCKDCGWMYPNAHPSAKIRNKHKKSCPGKVAAAAPAPEGSSEDESGDDFHHQLESALEASTSEVVLPASSNVSRDFDLNSIPKGSSVGERKEDQTKTTAATDQDVAAKALATTNVTLEKSQLRATEEEPQLMEPSPAVVAKEVVEEKDEITIGTPPSVVVPEATMKGEIPVVTGDRNKEDTPAETPPAAVTSKETTTKGDIPVVSEKRNKENLTIAKAPKDGQALPHPMMKDEHDRWDCKECGWMYPNAHPSAKIRNKHKKSCAGKSGAAAPVAGGCDEDSDPETQSSPSSTAPVSAARSSPSESSGSVSREFKLPTQSVDVRPTAASTQAEKSKLEAPAATTAQVQEKEAPKGELPPATRPQPEVAGPAVVKISPPITATAPKAASSAMPHTDDPNAIWLCKECKWTYPNAHPSAKHRRNHKKVCPGKAAAITTAAPGGSSDDESEGEHPHGGESPAKTTTEDAVEAPVGHVQERGMQGVGVHTPQAAAAEGEAPKADSAATSSFQVREQEAKGNQELKQRHGNAKGTQETKEIWVCKDCGWTYPNAHPSAKHRRNHKKVCKKTGGKKGESSSDTSSEDDDVGHFGRKKCFPCL